ncbi:ribosome-binding factor A [uncultured Gammaproteobacteria bacterium]
MKQRYGSQGRSQRQLRVGEELRHALAALLQRGDFRDPDLVGLANTVTVTEVRISPDLRNATAFVVPLGGGGTKEVLVALRRAAPFLRGQVGKALRLRMVPMLSFEPDTSFDQAGRIEQLLHLPEVERDLGSAQPPSSTPKTGKKKSPAQDDKGGDDGVEWDDDDDDDEPEESERKEAEIEWEDDADADADSESESEDDVEYEDDEDDEDEGDGEEGDFESDDDESADKAAPCDGRGQ